MRQSIAVVMDPLATVQPKTDTSYALMVEAAKRDLRVLHVAPSGIELHHDQVFFDATEVLAQDDKAPLAQGSIRIAAKDCAAVFVRTDPPFDADYLTATWLLSFAEKAGLRIVNSPLALRNSNEKIYALEFPEFSPKTLVAARKSNIRAFVEAQGGVCIAKPTDGHGGFGVVKLSSQDSNFNALIDVLSAEEARPIIVQAYLEGGKLGDKRILLVDGKAVAAIKRVPPKEDHRGNVHVGGHVEACDISPKEAAMCTVLGKRFKEDGLYFVGIDVIEEQLIEINVTSPTLVQEIKRLGGPDIAAVIFDGLGL